MHRIQVTDQTVTSVPIIHYILKSLDTKAPVALFTFSSCSCRAAQRNQSRNSFAETLSSLYTHNHLPADQTAGMTPTPVALSLGKTHTHLVRFVVFIELFSWRHCTEKVIIHVITQAFWFDPGVHFKNQSHYAYILFFIFHHTSVSRAYLL